MRSWEAIADYHANSPPPPPHAPQVTKTPFSYHSVEALNGFGGE